MEGGFRGKGGCKGKGKLRDLVVVKGARGQRD